MFICVVTTKANTKVLKLAFSDIVPEELVNTSLCSDHFKIAFTQSTMRGKHHSTSLSLSLSLLVCLQEQFRGHVNHLSGSYQ